MGVVACCQVVWKLEVVDTWAILLLIGLVYGSDNALWKLLGQAGALPQVRAYNGIPVRKVPLGNSPLGSKFTRGCYQQSTSVCFLNLMTASQAPRCVHTGVEGKKMGQRVFFCQLSLSFRFFIIDVRIFPRVR